ncbi:N6-adenosine-methyltransferase catalytic subunit-like isoform X2 [Acropora muricata]|uniref:N6-adenosine-methyltransferase catalytic subunit-like isoform X2 n=1 Tax=Acropora muricata TaxID=159855 RepID=UPI0034E3D474
MFQMALTFQDLFFGLKVGNKVVSTGVTKRKHCRPALRDFGRGIKLKCASTPPPENSLTPSEDVPVGNKLQDRVVKVDPLLETRLSEYLCNPSRNVPVDSLLLANSLSEECGNDVSHEALQSLLQKFAIQDFISIKQGTSQDGMQCTIIISIDHLKLDAVQRDKTLKDESTSKKRKRESNFNDLASSPAAPEVAKPKLESADDIESLLSMPTMKEMESKKVGEEILDLLNVPSHKEQWTVEKFKSQGGAFVHEFCDHGTRADCRRNNPQRQPCRKVHFRKIIQKHTDECLGDCSFLNTCFHMDTCKYVHYEVDYSDVEMNKEDKGKDKKKDEKTSLANTVEGDNRVTLYPPQWIQCDMRYFDMTVLGKFSVVMADPPWDIHMELPYGTMSDDEMRKLDVPSLQDEGYIFLWVTGRAMELGRECLKLWGYERCDELIWVKTNQLQRLIRTGRTGHWLNHGKEHCLVGVKGDCKNFNRGLDCDVLVAEVRQTSHKPDEVYGVIERLAPGTRKIELFGRQHNVQPNWITLGNQLDGVRLLDPEVTARFKKRYPNGIVLNTSSTKI